MGWFSDDKPDESETDKGLNDLSDKDLKRLADALRKDPREKDKPGSKPEKRGWW